MPDDLVAAPERPLGRAIVPREPYLPFREEGADVRRPVPQRMCGSQDQVLRHEPAAAKSGLVVLDLRDVALQMLKIVRHVDLGWPQSGADTL